MHVGRMKTYSEVRSEPLFARTVIHQEKSIYPFMAYKKKRNDPMAEPPRLNFFGHMSSCHPFLSSAPHRLHVAHTCPPTPQPFHTLQ